MNAEQQFKYDVAISFLNEDESLTRELNDLLSERLTTFVYFDRQKEVAGTDGEQTFNCVFGSQSRVVVVLHRQHWGTTPWTRIEETAIRNRAYEKGYDFLTVIPLDSPPTVPEWLPKTRIWIGLDRLGVPGAVLVIEARVQEMRGTPRQDGPVEKAARLSRKKDEQEQRRMFLGSTDGVERANQEVQSLFDNVAKIVSDINAAEGRIRLGCERADRSGIKLAALRYVVGIHWEYICTNSLVNSKLHVSFIKRDEFSEVPGREPKRLADLRYNFDVQLPDRFGWRQERGDGRFLTSTELANHILTQLLNYLENDKPQG